MAVEILSRQSTLRQLDVHYYYRFHFILPTIWFSSGNLCISISSKDRFIFYIKLSYAFFMAFPPFCLALLSSAPPLTNSGCNSCNKCLENSYRIKNICMKQLRSASAITVPNKNQGRRKMRFIEAEKIGCIYWRDDNRMCCVEKEQTAPSHKSDHMK